MISIEAAQLSKRFGPKVVLQELTFSHDKGILGIRGPNGSGKSTLLQCLAGLLRPSSGKITWSIDEQTIPRQEITGYLGYAAPYISLYAELNIVENLQFLSRIRKKPLETVALNDILETVELDHVREEPYQNLSTGQQQRARLASALFMNPKVLFLDEPGSNLDEKGKNVVRNILDNARNDQKLVVLASNNRDELQQCDRLLSVVDGSMMETEPST